MVVEYPDMEIVFLFVFKNLTNVGRFATWKRMKKVQKVYEMEELCENVI